MNQPKSHLDFNMTGKQTGEEHDGDSESRDADNGSGSADNTLEAEFEVLETGGDFGHPDGESPNDNVPADVAGVETLAPADPLRAYINSIRGIPRLTREQEHELAVLYWEKKDQKAAYTLVTSNLMLVVRLAFDFRNQFQNMLDLIQEGNIGLMQAVKRFNPFKKTRLSTYASFWIRAYMLKYILDNWRLVRVGTTNMKRKLLYNLAQAKAELEAAGGEAGTKLLADHFGTTEENIVEVQKSLSAQDMSLDAPAGGADGATGDDRRMIDRLASEVETPEEQVAEEQYRMKLNAALDEFRHGLKEIELELLDGRLMADEPATLQAIGDKFGITREAVRQAESRLSQKLRQFLQSRGFSASGGEE